MGRVLNPTAYRCRECGKMFTEDQIKKVREEYEGWGRPVFQEFDACPYCMSTDIHEAHIEDFYSEKLWEEYEEDDER